jgi:hypothetical protein
MDLGARGAAATAQLGLREAAVFFLVFLGSGGVREAAVDWICFLFLWICFFFVGMSSSSSLLASSVLHRPPQGEIHPESPFFFALCRLFILGSTLLWLGFMLLSMMLMWLGFGMSLLFLLG